MSDNIWADFEAAPLNFWVGDPVFGLWCPICNLPSGWKVEAKTDPNDAGEAGLEMYGCEESEGHGNAVRDGAA